jgi:hypothetical protein
MLLLYIELDHLFHAQLVEFTSLDMHFFQNCRPSVAIVGGQYRSKTCYFDEPKKLWLAETIGVLLAYEE